MPANRWTPDGLCALFVCDIAGFGDPRRRDLERQKIRDALYRGLRMSFDDDGIPYDDCYVEDRGDGALMAVPPAHRTNRLLTTVVERLRSEVRRHNEVSALPAQMQLRIAVNTGEVWHDGNGLVGTAVNHAFRILEAVQLKEALLRSAAEVGVIVSGRVYEDVVQHGLGLVDPTDYRRIDVSVKETITEAWLRVPGVTQDVVIRVDDGRRPALTMPDPPMLTLADAQSDLDIAVDRALAIRQLRAPRVRDQIVAELPLAIASALAGRRSAVHRADLSAIIEVCRDQPPGLREFLSVVDRFVGDSLQMDELRKAIDALEGG